MANRVDASDGSSTHFTVSEWAMLEHSDDGFSVAFRGAGLTWSQPNLFHLVACFRACPTILCYRDASSPSRSGLARLLPPSPPLSNVLSFTLSHALALPAGLPFVWVGGVTMAVDWCSIDAMGSSYDPSNSREYDMIQHTKVESHLRSQLRLPCMNSYVLLTRWLRSEWDPLFEILRFTKSNV